MTKIREISKDNFNVSKAKISDKEVYVEFTEKVEVDGDKVEFEHDVTAPVIPHPDLLAARDALKEALLRSQRYYDLHDESVKYLKGEQKQKVTDKFLDVVNDTEVTGYSIGGVDQLRGVVISGKMKNQGNGNSALNSHRIVFASDKLGYEKDVETKVELVRIELFKYLFENKKSQQDLFDQETTEEESTTGANKQTAEA